MAGRMCVGRVQRMRGFMIEDKASGKHEETLSKKAERKRERKQERQFARKIMIICRLMYMIVINTYSIQLQYARSILSEEPSMFQPLKRHR
jgi:hypothetical protein